MDAGTAEILAHELTDSGTADAALAGPVVERAGGHIRSVVTDGAPVDAAIRAARPPRSPPKIVVPPSAPSISKRGGAHGGRAARIVAHGRMAWPNAHVYV